MPERKFKSYPDSAPGDFYVENEECVSCGAPHEAAPDLIGWSGDGSHCIWKKQPATPKELKQAFAAFYFNCVGCYRYAGTDRSIMEEIGLDRCDYPDSIPPKV